MFRQLATASSHPVVALILLIPAVSWANDTDGDSVHDHDDNCPDHHNPDQEDADGDGRGDACDCCPNEFNPGQEDADGDGLGDVCDPELTCPLVLDFEMDGSGNAPPAGTIAEGQFQGVTIGARNHTAGHPDVAIVFDSAHPTGDDFDLGTPNEDFG